MNHTLIQSSPCFAIRSHCRMMSRSSRLINPASNQNELDRTMTELQSQSLDLKDMAAAAHARQQSLENVTQITQGDAQRTNYIESITTSLKSYVLKLRDLQGESDALCNGLREHFLKSNRESSLRRSAGQTTGEEAEKSNTSINEVDIELEEATPDSPMTAAELTEYLHEKSVDFSDCFNEDSLRQRYMDVKRGTYKAPKKVQLKEESRHVTSNEQKISMIREPVVVQNTSNGNRSSERERFNYGGSSNCGIMQDPYPGAERRMCDPMKYVWEVKQDICQGRGVNSSQVDIWCGPTKLEDHKRMYEYPQCQRTPMEVRMKGDTRINKNLC